MSLNDIYLIQNISFAYDNRHICCSALTEDFKCSVNYFFIKIYLINYENEQILGHTNFYYSSPYKIQDIEFMPKSCNSFLVCGIQTLQLWKL